jgi:hypothetical protein
VCELANILVIIGSFVVLNNVFDNEFLFYGLNIAQNGRRSAMDKMFPEMASCSLRMYGFSGSPSNVEFLCILSHSNLHQWIFLVLWACLVILVLMDITGIVRRVCLLCFTQYRTYVLWEGGSCKWRTVRRICHELNVSRKKYLQLKVYFYLF